MDKNKSGEMYSEHKEISPEKAQALLELMPRNRRPNKNKIRSLANLMLTGKWDNSHPQGLIFNKNGELIDGQHRLFALVEANLTLWFYCTFNANDDCIVNLDSGLTRTTDQTGQIMGLGTDRLGIAIAKAMLLNIEEPNVESLRAVAGSKVLNLYQIYEQSIIFAKQKKSTPPIIYAPIRAIIARAHYCAMHEPDNFIFGKNEELDRFIEILDSGFSTKAEDLAIIALRNDYMNRKAKGASSERAKIAFAAKTVSAISAYIRGETIRSLRPAKIQLFRIASDGEE